MTEQLEKPDSKYGFVDLKGQTFGILKVLEYAGKYNGRSQWKCICQCGNECFALAKNLKNGDKTACGCRQISHAKTHGKHDTPEYQVWADMLKRCRDPENKDYAGRGITVCERWLKFENFWEDMGARPSKSHTIDRKNNDLGYSPENCRWATKIEQGNNRRTNLFYEYQGRSLTIPQWARELGFHKDTIWNRIKAGWTIEKALTKPTQVQKGRNDGNHQ